MSLETDKEKNEELTAPTPEPAAGAEASAPAAGDAEMVRKLEAEKQQLTDQLLRKQAELENLRKRLQREKEEFLQYSLFGTLQQLLPVLDDFELALGSNGGGEEYRKGIELIYQQFRSTLQRLGLEPIESKGREFDPYVHEAVATVETEDYPDQQVVEELQRGYLYKQRLLRPARVKVARRIGPTPAPPSSVTQPE